MRENINESTITLEKDNTSIQRKRYSGDKKRQVKRNCNKQMEIDSELREIQTNGQIGMQVKMMGEGGNHKTIK